MFGDLVQEYFASEQKKTKADELLRVTSAPIWAALGEAGQLGTHDSSLDVSTPDYDQDWVSLGKNGVSTRGPDFYEELGAFEKSERVSRYTDMRAECLDVYEQRAKSDCEPDEYGRVWLPDHSNPEKDRTECLRMWADGMFPHVDTEETSHTDTSTHAGKAAYKATIPLVGEATGEYQYTRAAADGARNSTATSRPGGEGYKSRCARLAAEWYNADAADPASHYAL